MGWDGLFLYCCNLKRKTLDQLRTWERKFSESCIFNEVDEIHHQQ